MAFLLSTAYFAPIQYFSKLAQNENVIIERYENFPKQTYRNRCSIYGANGAQSLTVPVTKGNELKMLTKDIRIDYSLNWQKVHFKTIESAYRCSPFYEFYIDELMPCFEKKYEFLWDLNQLITNTLCDNIGIRPQLSYTDDFITTSTADMVDLRDTIHPKPRMFKPDEQFCAPKYHQVFETKFGFSPNLSVLDLLFCTGPDAKGILGKSYIG